MFYVCLVAVLIWCQTWLRFGVKFWLRHLHQLWPAMEMATTTRHTSHGLILTCRQGNQVTWWLFIRQVFPDGSRYEGQWKDGLKHGKAGGKTERGRDWHQVACYGIWGVIVKKQPKVIIFNLSMTLHDLNLTWTTNHLPGSLHIPRRRCLWWPLPWTLSAINSSIFQKWLRGGIRKIEVDSGV